MDGWIDEVSTYVTRQKSLIDEPISEIQTQCIHYLLYNDTTINRKKVSYKGAASSMLAPEVEGTSVIQSIAYDVQPAPTQALPHDFL